MLLVALHASRHHLVCLVLSYLPTMANLSGPDLSHCCYSCAIVCESIHGHNAHAIIIWFQVYYPGPLLIDTLSQIPSLAVRNGTHYWGLGLPGHLVPVGQSPQNCN